ncbi:hypothetical protein J2W97_000848 [Paenibacillus jamilae]|nr:hypothetical protein [Paenibacillus jamilae]
MAERDCTWPRQYRSNGYRRARNMDTHHSNRQWSRIKSESAPVMAALFFVSGRNL